MIVVVDSQQVASGEQKVEEHAVDGVSAPNIAPPIFFNCSALHGTDNGGGLLAEMMVRVLEDSGKLFLFVQTLIHIDGK